MRRIMVSVFSICLCLQGCTSLQTVGVPGESVGRAAAEIGETVEDTTRTGQFHRFEVTEVDDPSSGSDLRIAYADMATMQAVRRDKGKIMTDWAAVGVAAIVAFVAALGESCHNFVE